MGRCKICSNALISAANVGRKVSIKTRLKIGEANKGKLLGKNNPFYGRKHTKQSLIKMSLKSLERWQDKKIINKVKRSYPDKSGKNNPMFGKLGTHGRWTRYNNQWFRSTWEANFAKWCDLSGIKWLYESKTFDLGNTTYTPDFYLPKFDCYIEIKGYWREDAKKKYRLFCKKFAKIKLHVFNQKQMKILGLIK